MTTRKRPRLFVLIITLGLLSMGMSGSVWARGDSDSVGRGGVLGGVLQELVFPCQAACRNGAEDCIEPLKTDAVTWLQTGVATCRETDQSCRDACDTQ